MTTLIKHKKAHLQFQTLEKFEAGIELLGHEVKSLRNHKGTIEGAHVTVRGGEAYLLNMTIPPYQPENTAETYDPERPRKLLLHKEEIAQLAGYESKKGLTIVPLSVYSKGRTIKVSIAAAKGMKKPDKRELIKEREDKRRIEREMKQQMQS
jgi:SsrA-binding protein